MILAGRDQCSASSGLPTPLLGVCTNSAVLMRRSFGTWREGDSHRPLCPAASVVLLGRSHSGCRPVARAAQATR